MSLHKRGFTLYTALLSFILILLAGLLVNTMIQAERVNNEVVLEIEAQSRMQSLADLTRADALQVVNYGIRNAIEEYTQNEGNAYPYSSQTQGWEQVQEDFSTFFFGQGNGSILAGRIAANLHVIVQSGPRRLGGYRITIQGGQEPELKAAIQEVLRQTSGGNTSFIHVVQCMESTPAVDCVGTFYVDLDFSLIGDEQYEKLPAIHVYDESTGRELVEPVIPRGTFRIYVPLRIFRSLKYAHELAQGSLSQGGGLLDPNFHEQLGSLGVGLCDGELVEGDPTTSICGYRTQPFSKASLSVGPEGPAPPIQGGNLCPAEQAGFAYLEDYYPYNVPLICDSIAAGLGLCTLNMEITRYDPSSAVSRADAITTLARDLIENQVTIALDNIPQSSDFVLLTDHLDIRPNVNSFTTKTIQFEGINPLLTAEGKCTKLVNTDVTLTFEERNENYIVVDTRKPLTYEVRIVDSFINELPRTPCVSYCLSQLEGGGIGGLGELFIFGPNLADSGGACYRTACAAPETYNPLPACGNGIVEPEAGEVCEPGLATNQTCASIFGEGYTGTLSCTNFCQWDPNACVAPEPPSG